MADRDTTLDKETRLLLTGLRRALDARPHLLQGKEERGALFPGGQTGAGPANKALDEHLLLLTDPPVGTKAKRSEKYVRLTEDGRRYLLEFDTPKNALRGLMPIIEKTATRIEEISEEMRKSFAEQIAEVTGVLEAAQAFIKEALDYSDGQPEEEEESPAPEPSEEAAPSEGDGEPGELTPLRPGDALAANTETSADGEPEPAPDDDPDKPTEATA